MAHCAELTHSLRTPAHLLSSAKMHMLTAAIYYKHRYVLMFVLFFVHLCW